VYRTYLGYYAQSVQPICTQIASASRTLTALSDYLERSHVKLKAITIENIDVLFAEYSTLLLKT
jgi:hypothetical protein